MPPAPAAAPKRPSPSPAGPRPATAAHAAYSTHAASPATGIAGPHRPPPGAGPQITKIATAGRSLPDRTVLYATEGWGKSSLGAQFPDPIFLMTRGEDGLRKLLDNGLLADVAHFEDEAEDWNGLTLAVKELAVHAHELPYKTLVLDTLNGAERLCVEHVTQKEFAGSPKAWAEYGRGVVPTVAEWSAFLDLLNRVRNKGLQILLLAHAKVTSFKNPEGADYDRFTPDMLDKTWGITVKWADMVLFGQLETFVKTEKDAKKGKAAGGTTRLLQCERAAAFDAKNRHGLPAELVLPAGPAAAYAKLQQALADGRKTPQPQLAADAAASAAEPAATNTSEG